MNIVNFQNEKKYIRDFLSLPKSLYTSKDNMEDEESMKKLLTGNHTLSKYFTLYKFIVYDGGKPAGRFAITEYPEEFELFHRLDRRKSPCRPLPSVRAGGEMGNLVPIV